MIQPDLQTFRDLARGHNAIPLARRIFSDQLTPVLAYRRLVAPDDRDAPSFLLESVEGGDRQGRYSFLGSRPVIEILAHESEAEIMNHADGSVVTTKTEDPLEIARRMSGVWRAARPVGLPDAFCGGFVGYTGYDTVRYAEPGKLPFDQAPKDDRNLPDLHLGLYREVAVFDHVSKVVYAVHWVFPEEHGSVDEAFTSGVEALDQFTNQLQANARPLPAGAVDLALDEHGAASPSSTLTRPQFEQAVSQARDYILAGDIFQVVLSQRFERETMADPFEIYRALRIVNPSPYMIYLQARGAIFVASSPEILCRVHDGVVTNRPLAGTRRRGATPEEDTALEEDLLRDEKERAEHIMLVDLGRNDVGRVAQEGTVSIDRMMEIERYSHVMHISSTVTGTLAEGKDAWDALRAALPVGTISGAPKVRAMQIIDELEPVRRGPYGGGIGVVSFDGNMDIALALRTMIIPTADVSTRAEDRRWKVHLQAGAGIVADSVPEREYMETVHKASALGRAIDLAEQAFGSSDTTGAARSP